MKRIFSSIIAIVFLSLTGCGNQENDYLSEKKERYVYTGEIFSISESEKSIDGKDSIHVGDQIKFVLKDLRMTKSDPPIVFLDSLIEIARIES